MLVILPHGVAVDPEIVKYLTIRTDRQPGAPPNQLVFTVFMKTDVDEHLQSLGTFDNREEAEALSLECARRINKALGAGDEEEEESSDTDDDFNFDFDLDDDDDSDDDGSDDDSDLEAVGE